MNWANMTQQDFAARLNVSPGSLSSIFSGRTRPTSMYIGAIHAAFPQVSVNWLMFGEGEMLLPASAIPQPASSASQPVATDLFDMPAQPVRPQPQPAAVASGRDAASRGGGPGDSAGPFIEVSPTNYSTRARKTNSKERSRQHAAANVTGEMLSEAVASGINNFDKQERRITEIRVFYDNGTYESYFPPKK